VRYTKEAWTMVPEIPTCPYRGDLGLGFVIGVPGRAPLCVSSAQAVSLLATLKRHQIFLQDSMSDDAVAAVLDCGKISGHDQPIWSSRSNLHFAACASKALHLPLAASDAVCLQGALYGEGALLDFVESPSAIDIRNFARLLGKRIVVERRRHIMVGIIKRVAIGRLHVFVDFEKQQFPGFDPENFFGSIERVLWDDVTTRIGERTEGGFGFAPEHSWTFLESEKAVSAMIRDAAACTTKISLLRLFREHQKSDRPLSVDIAET
jgi:hypothetical protein